jgi:hypothetical protein
MKPGAAPERAREQDSGKRQQASGFRKIARRLLPEALSGPASMRETLRFLTLM